MAFSQGFIRFSAGNGDLIYRSRISRYHSSNDILPTSVAMWVFKTTAASMKGSQVGNRSAGRIGGPSGERGPNGGERICKILHFCCVSYGFSRGMGT